MPRRLRSNRGLSAQQAHQALSMLLHDGKVRADDVWKALKRRAHLLEELKAKLSALGSEGALAIRGERRLARKVKRRVSAKRRAAWAAQGRYMAAVRRLPKAKRAKIKAIREKSGVPAAIREARKVASQK
jgi:hypothetical protein